MLVVGAIVLLWVVSPSERRRRAVVNELEPGDSAGAVVRLLGEPAARCAGSTLGHLRGSFPPGWPSASVETALATLGSTTRERWVYPIQGRAHGCAPRDGQTEVGIDAGQRLLWYVTVTGKTPLNLPPGLTPAAPHDSRTIR